MEKPCHGESLKNIGVGSFERGGINCRSDEVLIIPKRYRLRDIGRLEATATSGRFTSREHHITLNSRENFLLSVGYSSRLSRGQTAGPTSHLGGFLGTDNTSLHPSETTLPPPSIRLRTASQGSEPELLPVPGIHLKWNGDYHDILCSQNFSSRF